MGILWERRLTHTVFVLNPEGRRKLGRYRRRWEGNTEVDLMAVMCAVVDRIAVVQDRI